MSQLRTQLLAGNKQINWIPAHIKEGRFGEWLKEVKDWNFSRERYWGTPLPVWRSKDHKSQIVVSSLADLKKYAAPTGNKFFGMRHGEGTHNLDGRLAGGPEREGMRAELTAKGIKQVEAAAKRLKKQKINLIVASPMYRSQQTAKILAKATIRLIFCFLSLLAAASTCLMPFAVSSARIPSRSGPPASRPSRLWVPSPWRMPKNLLPVGAAYFLRSARLLTTIWLL
jgi:hypothetical protein